MKDLAKHTHVNPREEVIRYNNLMERIQTTAGVNIFIKLFKFVPFINLFSYFSVWRNLEVGTLNWAKNS